MHAIAIHGGAGARPRDLSATQEAAYRHGLAAALEAGHAILESGGPSLDAVVAAVQMLEDHPLFNAGRGAALTSAGTVELDAAVMTGARQRAGAVACIRHVRNPILLARCVMERTPHVLLVGPGAEELALEEGLTLVPEEYFKTPERLRELGAAQRGRPAAAIEAASQGTVGAVALDAEGHLAAATSTGGTSNKRPGRVGDSPLIGAGTYAKNSVCAVSATGHGESFIRAVAAHHISNAVELRGLTLEQATHELLHDILPRLGGRGGVIAVDSAGNVVTDFSTEGMFRGVRDARGRLEIAIA
jgi:isoaspartyl peptidase/L-asparaginase-like protein (Ntn-hydrolase superfamily)